MPSGRIQAGLKSGLGHPSDFTAIHILRWRGELKKQFDPCDCHASLGIIHGSI
jgi:hypothetical protein